MPKAVVLGGYGLIGAACCRALLANDFAVTAVARSPAAARRSGLEVDWVFRDIARTNAAEWHAILVGADVVVNAAGALQDGPRDDLDAIHDRAIGELISALEGSAACFIQISAAGVSLTAPTGFFRSKARGDARLMASGLSWVILRPALVLAPDAYGGTALLRAAASVPGVFFRVFPRSRVQTVWIGDVAHAVVEAANGRIAAGTVADLTEAMGRGFAETVLQIRRWLGLPPWRWTFDAPRWMIAALGRAADLLGRLGWRSPLRSNALRSLEDGIVGDPAAWRAAGGAPCRPLEETLKRMPATVQERWFARMVLLLPFSIAVLSLFWIGSGLIALAQPERSAELLVSRGLSTGLARLIAIGGGLIDMALGLALLARRWAARAALASIAVALAYLAGSIMLAPDLWLDPLGPMLKVLPSLPLALIVAALANER